MTNYGWFALKGICIIAVIGIAVYLTNSGYPLWALLLMPGYSDNLKEDEQRSKKEI